MHLAPACLFWLLLGVAFYEWPKMAQANALGLILRQAAAVPGSSRHGLRREQPCIHCDTAVFLSDTEGNVVHAVLYAIVVSTKASAACLSLGVLNVYCYPHPMLLLGWYVPE